MGEQAESLSAVGSGDSGGVSVSYKGYVLVLLLLVYTINFTDRQILTILLEPIKQDLGISDTKLGFLSGVAFALFYATLGIPLARWADRHNRVTLISTAVAVWSAMTAFCGLASSFAQLAIARIGVGIGEAGCTPPAHSLISDYFASDVRARAMAIYAIGIPLGSTVGLMVGGWVNELYGWRMAFLCVGLPGIAVAILVKFTIREPRRGLSDPQSAPSDTQSVPGLKEVFSRLWQLRSYRHLSFAAALVAMAGYGAATWLPAFLVRIHEMGTGQIGAWLGPIAGIGGLIGTLLGGYFADVMGKRDARWFAWLPAIAMLLGIPFFVAAMLANDWRMVMLLIVVPTITSAVYTAPIFAIVQALAGLRMRATAAAVLLFVINLIGLGLGPQLIGVVSDLLRGQYGIESLRYTLVFTSAISVWAAAHFIYGARYLRADLGQAE